ncbi:50S ribosomal protein L23 [Mycoplasmopsis californica HAZ160_1]|uniref:Large ribosomal subunit protein uL23 n=1 Tax=Mycoplasmopsis californica HAZ160_1 TaxID=1397850 RepID=A0AAT9F7T6_9BACT|nr:50S ribosomal protein L23 [Mycoplasmopsis californica]BAP00947.1 50S ribosomal protein L23 [Mycoplasmopsis californica HAZ160_1]BBG40811.1 50S ribosomal protein L23 [Mycoplasmopsis californica]BBG41405.1 50S ribosomal protein L23 [Mycoplasmopsis californica]BBG41998.1 50S ribosomal protein L23 [Mycoplasmopsis californica]BBG42582.1 50S ribosomal protein L23 [Mycoplasmopsis californica]
MEKTQVIRRPILTEKTQMLLEQNKYTFEVDWAANKFQIKNAVEFIFDVKVVDVKTIKVDKKAKRVGRFNGFTNRYKKAVVTLAKDDKIVFYANENEAQDQAKAEAKAEKVKANKAQDQEVESKLAEKIAAKKSKKTAKEAEKDSK